MSSSTAVLSVGSETKSGEPRLLPERGGAGGGERREREKSGEGQRRETRAETTQVQPGTAPSHRAARREGTVDIYRKRDLAAVAPSHPDGGS